MVMISPSIEILIIEAVEETEDVSKAQNFSFLFNSYILC